MRPSTDNIFHTSLAFYPSSLTASTGMSAGTRDVASTWCTTTASCYGTRGMESFSWVVVSSESWRVPQGENV